MSLDRKHVLSVARGPLSGAMETFKAEAGWDNKILLEKEKEMMEIGGGVGGKSNNCSGVGSCGGNSRPGVAAPAASQFRSLVETKDREDEIVEQGERKDQQVQRSVHSSRLAGALPDCVYKRVAELLQVVVVVPPSLPSTVV